MEICPHEILEISKLREIQPKLGFGSDEGNYRLECICTNCRKTITPGEDYILEGDYLYLNISEEEEPY